MIILFYLLFFNHIMCLIYSMVQNMVWRCLYHGTLTASSTVLTCMFLFSPTVFSHSSIYMYTFLQIIFPNVIILSLVIFLFTKCISNWTCAVQKQACNPSAYLYTLEKRNSVSADALQTQMRLHVYHLQKLRSFLPSRASCCHDTVSMPHSVKFPC